MGKYALGKASGAVEEDAVACTGHYAGKPEIMFKPEHDRTD